MLMARQLTINHWIHQWVRKQWTNGAYRNWQISSAFHHNSFGELRVPCVCVMFQDLLHENSIAFMPTLNVLCNDRLLQTLQACPCLVSPHKRGLINLVKLFSHLKAVSVPYHCHPWFLLPLYVISNYHCRALFSLHIIDSIAYRAQLQSCLRERFGDVAQLLSHAEGVVTQHDKLATEWIGI